MIQKKVTEKNRSKANLPLHGFLDAFFFFGCKSQQVGNDVNKLARLGA